jgi:hypothetical protein
MIILYLVMHFVMHLQIDVHCGWYIMTERRSSSKVWLVGMPTADLICSRLPSKEKVLAKFMFHHINEKKSIKEASKIVATAVKFYWDKARIPTSRADFVEKKLIRLYSEYQELKKNRGKKFEGYRMKEEMFKSDLQDIFNVAHKDALRLCRTMKTRRSS